MNITEKLKNQIDKMTYIQLLRKWRFALLGDPMFEGESGDYFSKRFGEVRIKTPHDERVSASKLVGWEQ